MFRRISPALLLFLVAPFIAEFLLGNLPAKMLFIVLPLGLMYGTGAIFIRELVRHTGRGWPTLLLLAAAYGLFEEGLVTQSLFNPNYLHLRLLDYGFIPQLATGLPWLLYVITIHVTWSICVPVGLVECLFPNRLQTPWLKKRGLIITGLMFVLGSMLIARVSQKMAPYMASLPQLLSVVLVVILMVVAAFRLPKLKSQTTGHNPNSALLFIAPFTAGSLLMIAQLMVDKTWHWPWQLAVLSVLAIEAAFIAFLYLTTRNKQWTARQHWALTTGGISVYIWFGFVLDYSMHGPTGVIGHAVIVAVVLILVVVAFFRIRQQAIPAISSH